MKTMKVQTCGPREVYHHEMSMSVCKRGPGEFILTSTQQNRTPAIFQGRCKGWDAK